MKSAIQDLPVTTDIPAATAREIQWGDMSVGVAQVRQSIDLAPLLKGLPDDRCQCPHWGYVLKGQMRCQFADHEEVFSAGDVYYMPPGHSIAVEAGTEYVEFSPTDEMRKTNEVVQRNLQAMQ